MCDDIWHVTVARYFLVNTPDEAEGQANATAATAK